MTENLSEAQARWLTYLVFILITLLTIATGYQHVIVTGVQAKMQEMPDKYVMLERYKCDITDVKATLKHMNDKLDRLVERQ